jgi:hypothetical protein
VGGCALLSAELGEKRVSGRRFESRESKAVDNEPRAGTRRAFEEWERHAVGTFLSGAACGTPRLLAAYFVPSTQASTALPCQRRDILKRRSSTRARRTWKSDSAKSGSLRPVQHVGRAIIRTATLRTGPSVVPEEASTVALSASLRPCKRIQSASTQRRTRLCGSVLLSTRYGTRNGPIPKRVVVPHAAVRWADLVGTYRGPAARQKYAGGSSTCMGGLHQRRGPVPSRWGGRDPLFLAPCRATSFQGQSAPREDSSLPPPRRVPGNVVSQIS